MAIATDKYTQIHHAQSLECIKLSFKTFTVSTYALATKNGAVPEIGSDKM
jgi:hypothetical protein